jgi:DNA-binding transcriptional LysR family regulator
MSQRAYKEMTFQQLRSFCATARLGSLTAAASSLGLAHPTVWKQVHALEGELGEKLIEPHGRGCRLTDAGRLLAELAGPAVANIDSLKRHFLEARTRVETRLTVAATPRMLVEDLPPCVVEFERRHPHVRLTFKESRDEQVTQAVEAGDADLGLSPEGAPPADGPWLLFEPGYEFDYLLITPKDHPLARRRHVRPADLAEYPLVNSPEAFHDAAMLAQLERLGLFRTQPRRVEAYFAATVRRYVELGFGIGVVLHLPGHEPHPQFHERSMSRYFGRGTIYLVWRRGTERGEVARAFADTVKAMLGRPASAARPRR